MNLPAAYPAPSADAGPRLDGGEPPYVLDRGTLARALARAVMRLGRFAAETDAPAGSGRGYLRGASVAARRRAAFREGNSSYADAVRRTAFLRAWREETGDEPRPLGRGVFLSETAGGVLFAVESHRYALVGLGRPTTLRRYEARTERPAAVVVATAGTYGADPCARFAAGRDAGKADEAPPADYVVDLDLFLGSSRDRDRRVGDGFAAVRCAAAAAMDRGGFDGLRWPSWRRFCYGAVHERGPDGRYRVHAPP